jgi:hypothetical protein
MTDPKLYKWAYDGGPADVNPNGFMFSVGVYQWLPKTSGKGLKKSKTIRVVGYVMEASRVFEKANELCRTLNEKDVRAEKLPRWVQKQYSVPKPANLVLQPIDEWIAEGAKPKEDNVYYERFSNDLTGPKVRRVRMKVMNRILIPAGYVKGQDGTYVRQILNQVHLIDFQPSKFGHEYTVNLGFHYSFLPGFFRAPKDNISEFHLLDCALSARVNQFLLKGTGQWFAYGHDVKGLEGTFEQNALTCLRVFEKFGIRWSDARCWLNEDSAGSSDEWRQRDPDLFKCCIALQLKDYSRAERYFALLRTDKCLAPTEKYSTERRRYYNRILRESAGDKRYQV